MSLLRDMQKYGPILRKLRGFLRQRFTLDEAKAIIRQRMDERESNFLRLIQRGIFQNPPSPYLPLLRMAGCEFGDIQEMVKSKSIEETLLSLRSAGVYFSFEEFRGLSPAVRNGKVIVTKPSDFDNPYISHSFEARSGGTTGPPARVSFDLDHLSAEAPYIVLSYDAHGVLGVPELVWHNILPDITGIWINLSDVIAGGHVEEWFSPITTADLRFNPLKWGFGTELIVVLGRMFGAPIAWPRHVSSGEAHLVAQWAARRVRARGSCLVRTNVSMALRVAIAATAAGLDLTGVTFMGSSEPPTPAKVARIVHTGARYVPNYYATEIGAIGWGCARPIDGNDLHLFKDAVCLVRWPRTVPDSDIVVDAFNFTTLLPSAPKVMLNVESDDFGLVEQRSCGCPLESYGFTEHLREIYSFRKLTGEGVTIAGSEVIHILEEVLPARFGGSPLDYQLLEEEDPDGFTRVGLIISPRIRIAHEAEVIETFMNALPKGNDVNRAMWDQVHTMRIMRMEPILTSRNKLMPLHVTRRALPSGASGHMGRTC